MEKPPNLSIKQEIIEKSNAGSSKEKPIEINEDEESSDEENSVIILDSDTEVENDPADDEDDAVGDEESEEESDEDEEESEESSDESVSENSVWSEVDEAAGDTITTEAAEAKLIRKFEKAMYIIADNDAEKGRRILEKLLDDPIISVYHVDNPDYEVLEEPPRLARMLQVFVAIHKNLAKLDTDQEVAHLCQVLAYQPNDSSVWLDVAIKCVEDGDLNFAKNALKKCECLKESLEAHATVLYLSCDYTGCLKVMKAYQEEADSLNDKMKYLKFKIRSTSQYYRQLSDRIFEEDEAYAEINAVDQRKIMAFDERIEELRRKVEEKTRKREEDFMEEKEKATCISLEISADQDLVTVCTIFCDLFDRIHAYSHCRYQLIEVTEWESRKDYLVIQETVEHLVDIVDCVEEMTKTVEENLKKRKFRKKKTEYLASWRKRLFVKKPTEEVESDGNTTADEDQDSQEEDDSSAGLPENELASEFGLVHNGVVSIRTVERKKEKTPPPSLPHDFIDCDSILGLLEEKFSGESLTILEILEFTLLLISSHTSSIGAIPEPMMELMREMYCRLALFDEVNNQKYYELNVTLMELDSKKATEKCITRYLSPFFKEESEEENEIDGKKDNDSTRSLILRFMWKYSKTGLKEDIKLEYLYELKELMNCSESIRISTGSFSIWDVELAIEDLEKKKRIESVKHLWKSRNYQSLVEIIENDISFGSISDEETFEMLNFWLQSLEKLKKNVELAALAARALHYYLFGEFETELSEKLEGLVDSVFLKLQQVDFKKVEIDTISTIGYLISVAMKTFKKLEKDWKNWKILYGIVKAGRLESSLEYIETLDKSEDPSAMPLLEYDLLVKAHSVLGEYHCCAQKNYEFLFFIIDCFRELVDDIEALELCYQKDNGWLFNNMAEEVSQVLFCMYGKYGRKRKSRQDHENGGHCSTTAETARRVLALVLVQPLPLYDEKEKLMHDVIDLINSKFPYLLKISDEKKNKTSEFTAILKECSSLEDVKRGLTKCRDDVDDNTQSLVWYAMALTAFRSNTFKEATKYSELYLLTEESMTDDRLRSSIWGILAHASIHDLFQLDLHEIHEQWKWRIMPFRMALDAQTDEPVPHFQLAAILYQLASSLARFYRFLPSTDPRLKDISDPAKLRKESREHFDRCLELTKLGDDGSQPEHQWLCYFFIGKLEAKNATWDIVKVVESFYEAACGCELAGFYYPQKVQTKKQQNFEPLEVHYQAFSAVYKFLLEHSLPPLETLIKLRVLLKLMNDGHKVVKPSNSLFRNSPDVYLTVNEMVFEVTQKDAKDEEIRVEVVEELKDMCSQAFSLVTERFPHIKSYYRLAQLAVERQNYESAGDIIFKNIFKRKKRDDPIFDNIVEISCSDINRNGSFNFHIERSLKLGVTVAQRLLDLHNVVSVLVTMINVIVKDDEEHVDKHLWNQVVTIYLTAMQEIVLSRQSISTRSTPSPGPEEAPKKLGLKLVTLRQELWRLWTALTKCSKSDEELIRLMKAKTEVLIVHSFKSIEELRARMAAASSAEAANRKKSNLKRKLDMADVAQKIVEQTAEGPSASVSTAPVFTFQSVHAPKPAPVPSGPYLPLSDSDDDIQCLEPPPHKKSAPSTSAAAPSSSNSTRTPVTKPSVAPPKPAVLRTVLPLKPAAPKASTSSSASTVSTSTAAQNAALLASLGNVGKETMDQLAMFVLQNSDSTDEKKRNMAAQALQLITSMNSPQRPTAPQPPAQKKITPTSSTSQATQMAQSLQMLNALNKKSYPSTSSVQPGVPKKSTPASSATTQASQMAQALKAAKEAQALKNAQLAQATQAAQMLKALQDAQRHKAAVESAKKAQEAQKARAALEAQQKQKAVEEAQRKARAILEAQQKAKALQEAKEKLEAAKRAKAAEDARTAEVIRKAVEAQKAKAVLEAQQKAKATQNAEALSQILQAARNYAGKNAQANVQAQMNAQMIQALQTINALSAGSSSTQVRPAASITAGRPQVVAPKPIRPSLPAQSAQNAAQRASLPSTSQQSSNQGHRTAQRPAAPSAPAAPTIHRPVASRPSTSTAHAPRAAPSTATEQQSSESRANMLQFLNSIADPAIRREVEKTLLGKQ